MFNWYFSTHPKSPFVSGVMIGRPQQGRRHALLNTRYSVQDAYGKADVRHIRTVAEFREVLAESFGLNVPYSQKLEEKVHHLVESLPPVHRGGRDDVGLPPPQASQPTR